MALSPLEIAALAPPELELLATELVVHVPAVGEQTPGEVLPLLPCGAKVLTTMARINISRSSFVMP